MASVLRDRVRDLGLDDVVEKDLAIAGQIWPLFCAQHTRRIRNTKAIGVMLSNSLLFYHWPYK
jgi:hypothetical protein